MNAARQRRLALKKRIENQRQAALKKPRTQFLHIPTLAEAKKFEVFLERLRNSPENIEWRLRTEFGLNDTRRAFVFTKMENAYGLPKIVTVWLSTHHPTKQIMDMRTNGFWAWDHGYLTYFTPDSFTEVCFDNE